MSSRKEKPENSDDAPINLTVEKDGTSERPVKSEKSPAKSVYKPSSWACMYVPIDDEDGCHPRGRFDGIHSLNLVVEPSKFVINPEKGTKFTIKTNSKYKQDVIVMCDSYLFEIKNPRARNGMDSQIFHRLVKGETITFEIGLRLPSDRPTAYISASPPTSASGTLEIYHYRTTCQANDDSDEKWRIKEKNQFINGQIYSCQRYGRWVEYLNPEYETEDIKKRKEEFLIENFKYYEYNSWLEISEKTEKVMMTTVAPNDPEEKTDREAEENLKKGLKYFVDLHREEERKKKELEEKKVEKKDVETVQTVQLAEKPAEKPKKKKKKCVIM